MVFWLVEAYIFDLIAENEIPTRKPVNEISTPFQQACFSRCHYMPKSCQSIVIEILGERSMVCKIYDFTSDLYKERQAHTGA